MATNTKKNNVRKRSAATERKKTGKPLIALTQGDPAGIGPEICLKAAVHPAVRRCCALLIIGDLRVLEQASRQLKLDLPKICLPADQALEAGAVRELKAPAIVDCRMIAERVQPGVPSRAGGEASYRYIELAVELAGKGLIDAITTAPITKTTLKMAGISEPGHTEILARLTGCGNFAMMLYSPRLAVSFVTCHQSLQSVPGALRVEDIRRVAALTGRTLRRIRGAEPRLAVLGLNPHAGEGGLFGNEEAEIIEPAIELCRRDGWRVDGPLPPDAAFMPHMITRYDGFVTHYHDQGSIPFKMISLHDGVNITMGLPIIRTSVDHGTAYDIAWRGKAEVTSLISALKLAARLAVPPAAGSRG